MNRDNFLHYIHHPEILDSGMVEGLKELSHKYPYSSSVQILYAYGLYTENDLDFNLQLKRAAACVSSRRKLKELFTEKTKSKESTEVQIDVVLETIEQPDPIEETVTGEFPKSNEPLHIPEPIPEPGEENRSRKDLLELVQTRLAEIKAAKSAPHEPDSEVFKEVHSIPSGEEELPESEDIREALPIDTETGKHPLSREEILEKFIREEPRISPPRSSFYKPSEIAAKSSIDEEEIISETLARLFYEQGNGAKAIKIYEKLSLLFPEKSRYFADQILQINNK